MIAAQCWPCANPAKFDIELPPGEHKLTAYAWYQFSGEVSEPIQVTVVEATTTGDASTGEASTAGASTSGASTSAISGDTTNNDSATAGDLVTNKGCVCSTTRDDDWPLGLLLIAMALPRRRPAPRPRG
jgi:MYXO-CTERM domain-containing protein